MIGDRLLAARIPYFRTSVNWSKYSKPWDVIFDHQSLGFAQVLVRDLPTDVPKQRVKDQKAHAFVAEHVPIDDNYPHSEICAKKDGKKVEKQHQISDAAKKEFRTIMSDRSLVLWDPRV